MKRTGSYELETVQSRFEAKFVKEESGCWRWIAGMRNKRYPYGNIVHKRKTYFAHRFAYELYIGKIPEGMLVCHHCDNPSCVNPDHLFLGTVKDNTADMLKKGRQVKAKAYGRLLTCTKNC
jgi:hypothetical protein